MGGPLPVRILEQIVQERAAKLAPAKLVGPERLGPNAKPDIDRIVTGIETIDEVFGGGLPKGAVILLAGAPGGGKSTCLGHITGALVKRTLYVTTEESLARCSRRMFRVLGHEVAPQALVLSTIDKQVGVRTLSRIIRERPEELVVIDSLQGLRLEDPPRVERDRQRMLADEDASGRRREAPMLVQRHSSHTMRDIAMSLISLANEYGKTLILTSHVNKEGDFAGVKEIEHLVDVVAWFTGTPPSPRRELRCSKNRDGDTSVIGHFEMGKTGLTPLGVGAAGAEQDGTDESGEPVIEYVDGASYEPRHGQPYTGERTQAPRAPRRVAAPRAASKRKPAATRKPAASRKPAAKPRVRGPRGGGPGRGEAMLAEWAPNDEQGDPVDY